VREGVGDEAVIGELDEDPGIVQSCRPRAANKLQGGQKAMVDFWGSPRGGQRVKGEGAGADLGSRVEMRELSDDLINRI
jgi:hypothetical protein